MAQTKLQLRHSRRALIARMGALAVGLSTGLIASAQTAGAGQTRPVGLTLLFLNVGQDSIGVTRFDPDGLRGPTPGALGPSLTEGKQMTFMPGDSKRGVPQFVDVEWVVETPEAKTEWKKFELRTDRYSQAGFAEIKRIQALEKKYAQQITLTSVINLALLETVRANAKSGNIKLTVKFNNDQVKIEAQPEQFR